MRILYDVYTTKKRTELVLLLADWLVMVSAIIFASGILNRPTIAVFELGLLVAWCLIPRGVASFLAWFDRPREFARSVVLSTILCMFILALVFSGWELIWESAPWDHRPSTGTAIALILTWICGFLLCIPRAYRLQDFLGGATVLLALLDRHLYAAYCVPVFIVSLFVSSATRHLLYDVFPRVRNPRVNLQNARALSFAAGAIAALLFVGLFLILFPFLDEPQIAKQAEKRRPRQPMGLSGIGRSLGGDGELDAEAGDGNKTRTVGYSSTVRLSDLSNARYDSRVIFVSRLIDEEGKEVLDPPASWLPEEYLWKVNTLSEFEAATNSWREPTELRRHNWPKSGQVTRATLEQGERDEFRMETVVVTPVFTSLVHPYSTDEFGPIEPAIPDAFYFENGQGDLFPADPAVGRGFKFKFSYRPWTIASDGLPVSTAEGTHEDPSYLSLPRLNEIGINLQFLAESAQLDSGTILERVEKLREYFVEAGFEYNTEAPFTDTGGRLALFLSSQRLGDCTYYATSTALLLRAAGVSTRVAVGFLGSPPDKRRPNRVTIRNSSAHTWAEVYFPGAGWFPVDATAWVPLDEEFKPPPDPEDVGSVADSNNSGRLFRPRNDGTELDPDDLESSNTETIDESVDEFATSPSSGDRFGREKPSRYDIFDLAYQKSRGSTPSWLDKARSGRSGQDGPSSSGSRPHRSLVNDDPPDEEKKRGMKSTVMRSVLVILALLSVFLLLMSFLRPKKKEDGEAEGDDELDPEALFGESQWIRDQSRNLSDTRLKLLWQYHDLHQELAKTRNHRLPHETPVEHGRRYDDFDEDLDTALAKLHNSVYWALYGEKEPADEELREVSQHCQMILRRLG